jgi:hypothetical protein
MAIPPASALVVNTNPFSRVVTQAEFNGGTFSDGVANEVWFKLTVAARTAWGLYTNNDNVFFPTMVVFKSDGVTQVMAQSTGASGKKAAMWADLALADTPHYCRIRKNPVGASAFDFTFNSKTVPIDGFDFPIDALVISDDTSPFPAAIFDNVTGDQIGFSTVFPAGEIAATLPTGISLWHDRFNKYGGGNGAINLVSGRPNPAFVMNVTGFLFGNTFPSSFPSITANDTDFYLMDRDRDFGTGYHIYKITAAGVVTHLGAIVSPFGENLIPIALGVSMDGSELYFATASPGDNFLHKWKVSPWGYDGVLYTAPDLLPSGGHMCTTLNGHPGDIVVLPDDSVVFWWQFGFAAGGNDDTTFAHVSAAGALLHQKNVPGIVGGFDGDYPDHLTRVGTDSTRIKVWLHDARAFFAKGHWFTWLFSPDSEIETRFYDNYNSARGLMTGNNGTYTQPAVAPSVGFPGPSECCPFVALRDAGAGPGPQPGVCEATQTVQCLTQSTPSTQCNTNSPRSMQSIQQTPAMNTLSVSEAGA